VIGQANDLCYCSRQMSSPQPTPQFEKADFGDQPKDACMKCNQAIVGTYYRRNGAMLCPSCANILQHEASQQPTGNFTRALLFGMGGALIGLILYSAVGIITGLEIGYVSLAVGYIIAKAMLKGSGGIGGRKYQMAALILTYMAVSMSAVPIGLRALSKQQNEGAKVETSSATPQSAEQPTDAAEPAEASQAGETSEAQPAAEEAKAQLAPSLAAFFGAILLLAGVGSASPFLGLTEGVSGVIGLVILFVGLNIAWRMTAGSEAAKIEGPYTS
jgi:hypothetical protein